MKARKLKAILAAVSAVAVMVTATTGFAAEATVSTTTTYNANANTVSVVADVSGATAESEVAYIVKSGSKVLYIDQATAEGGAAQFSYKFNKSDLTGLTTSVKFGSDKADTFTGTGTANLGLANLPTAANATYTITYAGGATVTGYGENVDATVAAATGYEITSITVNGEPVEGSVISVNANDIVVVNTTATQTTGSVTLASEVASDNTYIAVIQPVGNVAEFGVVYNGELYPSLTTDAIAAVKIVLADDAVAAAADFGVYYKATANDAETIISKN